MLRHLHLMWGGGRIGEGRGTVNLKVGWGQPVNAEGAAKKMAVGKGNVL